MLCSWKHTWPTPADEELLGFTCHPNAIFALKKLKKKELKLLPIGNCVPVQEKEYDKIVNKGKGVVVWYAKKGLPGAALQSLGQLPET